MNESVGNSLDQWLYEYKEFIAITALIKSYHNKYFVFAQYALINKLNRIEPEPFKPKTNQIIKEIIGDKSIVDEATKNVRVTEMWSKLCHLCLQEKPGFNLKSIDKRYLIANNCDRLKYFEKEDFIVELREQSWVKNFLEQINAKLQTRKIKRLNFHYYKKRRIGVSASEEDKEDIHQINYSDEEEDVSSSFSIQTKMLDYVDIKSDHIDFDNFDADQDRVNALPCIIENNERILPEFELDEVIEGDLIAARFGEHNSYLKNKLQGILAEEKSSNVILRKFNVDFTIEKFHCLKPRVWLNDEVINFYFKMLEERDVDLSRRYHNWVPSHFFSSFFMFKLLEQDSRYNYDNVTRWTKKFNIFEKKKIYIPINISNTHWTLLIIYMGSKQIRYHDSQGGHGQRYLTAIMKWLTDEGKKNGKQVNPNEWIPTGMGTSIPQQIGDVDCGLFVLAFADLDLDDLRLDNIGQRHMQNFRIKVGIDILRGKLTYPF